MENYHLFLVQYEELRVANLDLIKTLISYKYLSQVFSAPFHSKNETLNMEETIKKQNA